MAHICPNRDCPVCWPNLAERSCDRCGAVLEFVFDRRSPQYVDSLHLRFDGGYGEFIDRLALDGPESNSLEVVVCGRCVEDLMAIEPWLRPHLRPINPNQG